MFISQIVSNSLIIALFFNFPVYFCLVQMKLLAFTCLALVVIANAMPSDLKEFDADGSVVDQQAFESIPINDALFDMPMLNVSDSKSVQFANILPGFQGAISAHGLETILNRVIPQVIAQIRSIPIPGESGKASGFKYEIKDIQLQELSVQRAVSSVSGSGLSVHIQGLHVVIRLHWKFKKSKLGFPRGSGSARITIDSSDIGGTVAINAVNTPQGVKPQIRMVDANVNLNNFKIHVSGSILSFLYNLVIKLFQNKMKHAIAGALRTGIINGVNAASDRIVATMPTQIPVSKWGVLDLSLTQNAAYFPPQGEVMLAFNGEVLPISTRTSDGRVPRGGMPYGASGRMISVAIHQFVLNSAFHSWGVMGGVTNKLLSDSNKPAGFPTVLATNAPMLTKAVPSLNSKYANSPIQVKVVHTADPTVKFANGQAIFGVGLDLVFQVNFGGALIPVFTAATTAQGSVGLGIQQRGSFPAVIPRIVFTAAQAKLKDSLIGQFDINGIVQILNGVVNLFVLPQLNAQLDAGIPLPAVAGMQFVNPALTLRDGYIFFAGDLGLNSNSIIDHAF